MLTCKIENDWEILGGHRAVCNDMMNSIPTDCRLRVSHRFSCGGPRKNWNYKKFIEHFNDNFEDKNSTRTAAFELAKMKQGKYQPFSDYLRDFEYTLAQAKGLNWEDRIKINDLYRRLNDRLTRALYPIEVSEDNYTLFVNQVCGIAGRIEAHENQMLRHPGTSMRTMHNEKFNTQGNSSLEFGVSHGPSRETKPAALDTDGDTTMSGLNGLSIERLAALVNAVNSKNRVQESNGKNKPPAPWRSSEEFNTLRAAGKCTRCGRKGHWHRKCPHFSWAKRPADVNAASSNLGNRFEGEADDIGFLAEIESGKE